MLEREVRLSISWSGLGREFKAALEVGCVAILVFLLPWPLAFRGLRFLTRYSLFQGREQERALGSLVIWRGASGPHSERLIALHRLTDIADFFLTLKYGRSWMKRYLHVSGDALPVPGELPAPMLVTFHYGQGFWALRYFCDHGYPIAWLHAPPPKVAPWGEKFVGWMGHRRISQVARLSGAPTIAVGGSIERMRRRLLAEGRAVMVMPDAPLQPGQSSLPVRLLGRDARLPAGAIGMASEAGVPVLIYTIVIDPCNGHRHMRLEGPFMGLDAQTLAQRLADHLQVALDSNPEAWHVWPWVSGFFPESGRQ